MADADADGTMFFDYPLHLMCRHHHIIIIIIIIIILTIKA